jgi:plasmid stabilization system protein ParE
VDFIGNELQDEKAIGISLEKLELKHEAAIRTDIRNKAEHDRREICRKVELKKEEEDQRYQRELTAEMRRLVEEKLNPDKPWSNDDVNGIISEAERSKFAQIYWFKTLSSRR